MVPMSISITDLVDKSQINQYRTQLVGFDMIIQPRLPAIIDENLSYPVEKIGSWASENRAGIIHSRRKIDRCHARKRSAMINALESKSANSSARPKELM